MEENIRLTMAYYNVDWQTACDMKRGLLENNARMSVVTVKDLHNQVQQELIEHEKIKE